VSKETLKNDGILLGYQSVDDLYDTNSLLVKAEDIFTEGTVRLGGIKVFSNTKLDEAFLDAASLSYHGGSLLQQLFADLIKGRENLLYPIDNFSYEDGMGLCGWIKNRRILLGSRELMETHNIEGVPTKTREAEYAKGHEPIYLSISGSLAAMFVVDVIAGRGVRKWAERLVKKKVCIVVKSVDSFITAEKISAVYGIPNGMVKVLPKKLHEDFDAETKKAVRLSASMACAGKFSSMAQLILGIKNIHTSAVIALIFQTVSILLGFGLSMMLILSKAYESNYIYMSATAMIVYNLICTLLTCFAAGSKKR
jgi:Cu+-exporting ATPase